METQVARIYTMDRSGYRKGTYKNTTLQKKMYATKQEVIYKEEYHL